MQKTGVLFKCLYGFVKGIYYGFYNVHVEGRENLPDGGYIIASNHRSYADPPILAVTSGCSKFSFVAKEELFRNRFFGWLIRKLGAFPVSRGKGDLSVIDDSVSRIKDGRRLVIFPEGTRSKTGKVGRGKTGVALIAARADVPVVPAGIIFEGKLHFRSRITVRYGKPINADELKVSSEPTPHELKEIKGKIMGSITELVEGEGNG